MSSITLSETSEFTENRGTTLQVKVLVLLNWGIETATNASVALGLELLKLGGSHLGGILAPEGWEHDNIDEAIQDKLVVQWTLESVSFY